LAMAGLGPDRTMIDIWADPAVDRNIHRIEVEADAARFSFQIENVPSLENPKTGRMTPLSVIALLKKLTSPLALGTGAMRGCGGLSLWLAMAGAAVASTSGSTSAADFQLSYAAGFRDAAGGFAGGTEMRLLVAHGGRLYAGNGYWEDRPGPEGR